MSETNPLLNNSSVQGAAKSIEGLLNSKGVISETQKEAAPVAKEEPEAKAEDNQTEQQPTAAQPEQEAPVQEEASEDSNAENEQETDLHQIIVNGEKIEVDLDELKAGYQKDADYRRKTAELALEKSELKAEKDRLEKQYSTKLDDLNSLVLTLNAEVNGDLNSKELEKLWEEDPMEATKIDRKIRRRREQLSQAQKKLRDHQETQRVEFLKQEQTKLKTKYPDLQDPVKANSIQTNMINYLLDKGFTQYDINQVIDSRMFDVIFDGMSYTQTKKLKPNLVSKKVKPSKLVRSGVKATKDEVSQQQRLEQIKMLKKSGSPKDATDLLMRYL